MLFDFELKMGDSEADLLRRSIQVKELECYKEIEKRSKESKGNSLDSSKSSI